MYQSKLKPELDEYYRERREDKWWFYTLVAITTACVLYFGIHLLAYWLLN